jgi:uncharacterized membrane protein (UPF0182 family)
LAAHHVHQVTILSIKSANHVNHIVEPALRVLPASVVFQAIILSITFAFNAIKIVQIRITAFLITLVLLLLLSLPLTFQLPQAVSQLVFTF